MSFLPLSLLFQSERAALQPVAMAGGRIRTWAEFLDASGRVAAHAGRAGTDRWVLACADAWEFACGFAGLLLAGRTVVLPANFLPDTLAAFPGHGLLADLEGLQPGPAPGPGVLDGRVEFWTSGSTGEPKGFSKTLAQLDAEVALLEATFGGGCTGAPTAGTLPHHHIYGCLFRVLWPLAAGRPFLSEPCGDPGRLLEALETRPVLVSSPAHLSRLPRLLELGQLPSLPSVLFSSGGPLSAADAQAWRAVVPGGVIEIYGSTETGGIAWRIQGRLPETAEWTPFPDVTLAFEDGALVVSGFRAGTQRMEDAAEPAGHGRFRLLGRLDRTLKLEEKRVSLPELEAALEAHPWVSRAAVALLEGPRPALGAVLALAPGAPDGRARRVAELRRHLALRFEPVALPRRWRFVPELPYDARGKLTAQALAELLKARP